MNDYRVTLIGWAGFILMLVLFLQKCGCVKYDQQIILHDTTITKKYDSVPKYIKVNAPVVIDSAFVAVPVIVDTAAILKRYFAVYHYSQTLADTNVSVTITDTLTQNKIIARGFIYKLLKPVSTTIITNTIEQKANPTREFYAGGFIQANNKGSNVSAGAQLHFKTKKQTLHTVGYDALQQKAMLGISIKIGKHGRN